MNPLDTFVQGVPVRVSTILVTRRSGLIEPAMGHLDLPSTDPDEVLVILRRSDYLPDEWASIHPHRGPTLHRILPWRDLELFDSTLEVLEAEVAPGQIYTHRDNYGTQMKVVELQGDVAVLQSVDTGRHRSVPVDLLLSRYIRVS